MFKLRLILKNEDEWLLSVDRGVLHGYNRHQQRFKPEQMKTVTIGDWNRDLKKCIT